MITRALLAKQTYMPLIYTILLALITTGYALAKTPITKDPLPASPAAPALSEPPKKSAAPTGESSEKRWTLNQQNADIREFIAQIAKITEETFVVDPRIKGGNTVTVISNKPLTKDQVYDVFLEVLTTNGYTVVPKGRIMNIVPSTTAKTASGHGQAKPRNAIMTTKVIELHSVSSIEVIPIIRPLIAQYGHAAASASSNAVIVTDLADNVERISKLVKELDNASNNDYEVLPLKHAWVGDVAKIIQETLISGKGQIPSGFQVIADELSNRLVVKGNASKRAMVRKLVETLDSEGIRKSTTKVMFLSYADAKNLATILSEASETMLDAQFAKGAQAGSQPSLPSLPGQPSGRSDSRGRLSKNIFVKADETQNALVMIADPDTLMAMEQIVRQLDRPRAQVLLEAAIVEVTGGINDALGIQWGIDGKNTLVSRGSNTDDKTATGKLSTITGHILDNSKISLGSIALRDKNFGVLVHALSNKSNNNILSTPSLLTLDNQEAEFLVGENIPIKTGSYQTASQKDSSSPFTTTERKDIGIKLKITPHLSEKNSLRLELEQEISSLGADSQTKDGDFIYSNRTLKTAVMVDDGQTIVIGGLLQDDRSKTKNKVPLLGDIPLLGNLFKYNTHGSRKRNLMLFVRPTIMRSAETLAYTSQDRFNRLKLLQKGNKDAPAEHFPATPSNLFDAEAFDLRERGKPGWTN